MEQWEIDLPTHLEVWDEPYEMDKETEDSVAHAVKHSDPDSFYYQRPCNNQMHYTHLGLQRSNLTLASERNSWRVKMEEALETIHR